MLVSRLNLDPGETILMEVRRHWFVFLSRAVGLLLGAIAPLVLGGFLIGLLPSQAVAFFQSDGAITVFAYALWLLLLWVMFFVQWTNYYLDVWYVTEKRIIDVDQKGMFHREVANLRFDKIQDISVEVRGIIPTFLNFGDLRVQTAAEDSTGFFMRNASHPEEVRKVIFSRHNREAEKMQHKNTTEQTRANDHTSTPHESHESPRV